MSQLLWIGDLDGGGTTVGISDAEFRAMLKRAHERGEDDGSDVNEQEASSVPVKLVYWRDRERAVPTAIVRSALFGVVQRGRRPYLKKELIASWKNCEIRYTGQRLNQYDQDIWMQTLHFSREQDLSDTNGICFSFRSFFQGIGGWYGGARAKFLHDALERMRATAINIRMGSFSYVGGLIDSFVEDEARGLYVVRHDQNIAGLFGTGYTKIEAATRRSLSTQIARYLHLYIRSHKATKRQPHRISLVRLQELMGSQTELKDFRRKVRRAMDELQRAGVTTSWRITEGDALEFVRARGQQAT